MAAMPKHLSKISKFGGQYRLTIPKLLIEEMKWQDVEFVVMVDEGGGLLAVRRFIDAESLRAERKEHRHGSDR